LPSVLGPYPEEAALRLVAGALWEAAAGYVQIAGIFRETAAAPIYLVVRFSASSPSPESWSSLRDSVPRIWRKVTRGRGAVFRIRPVRADEEPVAPVSGRTDPQGVLVP
jgi:hypothetical protein